MYQYQFELTLVNHHQIPLVLELQKEEAYLRYQEINHPKSVQKKYYQIFYVSLLLHCGNLGCDMLSLMPTKKKNEKKLNINVNFLIVNPNHRIVDRKTNQYRKIYILETQHYLLINCYQSESDFIKLKKYEFFTYR